MDELIRDICVATGCHSVSLSYSEHEDRLWEAKAIQYLHNGDLTLTFSCHDDDPVSAVRGMARKIRNRESDSIK